MSWQEVFADERLKRLIALALANNRDLSVAVLNAEESRAQFQITRSASYPTVDGSGGFTRERSSGSNSDPFAGASGSTSSQWTASLGVTAYELDVFGRVRSLNQQALEEYLATEEAQREARISLVAQIANQYFTIRQLEEQCQLARSTIEADQESVRLNRAMFDAGATNELDLRTAEGQVQTAKIDLLGYERQLAQAENALVLLVGEPIPADLPAPRRFEVAQAIAAIPEGLPSELLQRRPDILEAEHTLKAANANIGAARAAFFPTISLTGSVGTASSQLSSLFKSHTGVWSFAPEITVPIFTGGKNRAELDAARISARIEVANYEKAIQTAFREVADALIAVANYASQTEAEQALIDTEKSRLAFATLRYRNGEDSYLNVLSSQQDLYGAQQGLLQAELNELLSQISLYQALGGGWK
jgi:multidrug efflux system outer membrane protein